MPAKHSAGEETLVSTGISIPIWMKEWLQGEAFKVSSPNNVVSMAEIVRRFLEEKYEEQLEQKG